MDKDQLNKVIGTVDEDDAEEIIQNCSNDNVNDKNQNMNEYDKEKYFNKEKKNDNENDEKESTNIIPNSIDLEDNKEIDNITQNKTLDNKQNNNLDKSFDEIEEQLQKYKVDEKIKGFDNIQKKLLEALQRQNRLNEIDKMITSITKEIEEFNKVIKIQKQLFKNRFDIEEYIIKLNRLNDTLKLLTPDNIINIKRKFLDSLIYLIIKNNAQKFELDKNYSPDKNYLEKILEKLNSMDKNEIINKNIKFINTLIENNSSITSFPLIINDKIIEKILKFLNYYKSKCNPIVHIEKENVKNYLLPYDNYSDKTFSYIFNIFKQNGKTNTDSKKINSKDNKQKVHSIYDENIKFEIREVVDFLFKGKIIGDINNINDINYIKEIEKIKKNKVVKVDETYDLISNLFNSFSQYKSNDKIFLKLRNEIFSEEEKLIINNKIVEFGVKLNDIKLEVMKLNKDPEDYNKCKKILNNALKEIDIILSKEIQFDFRHYYLLNETSFDRKLLIFYQYKIIKLYYLSDFIKDILELFGDFIKRQENIILYELDNIKKETQILNEKIKEITYLQSGKEIFLEWKSKKCISYYYDDFIQDLINKIRFDAKVNINDDFLIDQITTCWIVKNGLDYLII